MAEAISTIEDHLNGVTDGTVKVLCPFHDDVNASAMMYPTRSFYCFGCGTSLNVTQLVARLRYAHCGAQAMSMARRFIADGGLGSFVQQRDPVTKPPREAEILVSEATVVTLNAMRIITKEALRRETGVNLRLRRDRGLKDPRNLPLGWALDDLPNVLARTLGLSIIAAEETLVTAGVCYPAKEGDDRDASTRFRLGRHRLLIFEPRTDKQVGTIFYQGRATSANAVKYLSPPRIPKPLMGWASLDNNTDHIWLCEGPFDILPLIEASEAAIATTGSDLKQSLVEDLVLKADGREIIVAMDGDSIGQLKAPIIQKSLQNAGAAARILRPPAPYKDVGEWITREGVERVIDEALWSR